MLKLKDWAKREGIAPHTAYRWFQRGILPVKAERVGPRLICVIEEDPQASQVGKIAIYARVSSADQKSDLDGQVLRIESWLTEEGLAADKTVLEVASGMNGNRPKLRALLADSTIKTIVVEHRDRFGRMNTELIESALAATGRRLLVVDPTELEDDLVRDVTEVLTSLCARLYGRRSAANRAARAIAAATHG